LSLIVGCGFGYFANALYGIGSGTHDIYEPK